MRITALVENLADDAARSRIALYRPALENAGHTLDIRAWPNHWLTRLLFLHHVRHTDLLILQLHLLPRWQLRLLRQRVRWLVFDLDEAIDLGTPVDARSRDRRQSRFAETVQVADVVVAGSEQGAAQARSAGGAEVVVIPTCVDVMAFDLVEHSPARKSVTLCVSPALSEAGDWLAARLAGLEKSLPSLQLRTFGGRSLTQMQPCTQNRPKQQASVPADLGASWIPDEKAHAGACMLPLLHMMAAGLPLVANPVGVHKQLVRHGETGFLAESPAEWEQAVRILATDASLRRRMGHAGRRLVESHYHVHVGSKAWLQLLQSLEDPRQRRAAC